MNELEQKQLFCPQCGSACPQDQAFCAECGASILLEDDSPKLPEADRSSNPRGPAPEPDPVEAACKRRRTKKILAAALACVICAAAVVVVAVYQSSFTKIDAKQWIEVTYSGLNGNATASVSRGNEYMDARLAEALGISAAEPEDADALYGFAAAAAAELRLEKLYDDLDFDVDVSPSDHLSNGDQISVKITYDEAAAKEASIKVQNTEFTVTVEGLPDGKEYDIFQNVRLVFEGTSPRLTASVDTGACDSFIKDYVTFQISPRDNLKNGDKVTVSASWNRSKAAENLYLITKEKQEYTVSGQPEYLSTLKEEKLSGLQAEINDYIEAKIIAAYPPYTSMPGGDGPIKSIKLKGLHRQYLLVKKATSDSYGDENRLIQIYRFTASNENGAKDIYSAILVNNMIKSGGGEVSWNDIWQKGPYEKAEDLINDYVTKEKSDYTVETAE